MTKPDTADIQAEVANAYEALEDAQFTLSDKRLKTATSRAYYAMFYAVRVWSKALAPTTHKGVIHLFLLHVVKPGLVDETFGQMLQRAREERELADYHAITGSFDPADVDRLVKDARQMEVLLQDSHLLPNT